MKFGRFIESFKNDHLDQFICSKLITMFENANECTCCDSLRIFMIIPFIFSSFNTFNNNGEKLVIAYADAFMRRQQNAKGILISFKFRVPIRLTLNEFP